MRVAGRAAATAVIALLVGFVASFVAGTLLRSATPEAGLLWRVAQPSDVAIWTLAGAHGAPLRVEAGVEVDERVRDIGEQIGGRIGDLIGRDDVIPEVPEAPSADLRVRFASFTILGLAGVALAGGMFLSGVRSLQEAVLGSAAAAGLYALGLALLATTAGVSQGVDLRIASATASVGVPVVTTLVLGAMWAFAFALLGALRAPSVADALPPMLRTIGGGMTRAAIVGAASAVVCLIVMALTRGGGGGGPGIDGGLAVVGVIVLGVNVVAAGVVLAHGAAMSVSIDAGPLDGFTKLGYFPEGSTLPATRWLFLVVPVAAGLAAGRAMRSRTTRPALAAVGFGVAWGIALALIAAMLRVDALSNFSIGSLEAGGALRVGPAEAFLFGFLWATVTSYLGLTVGAAAPTTPAFGESHPSSLRVELPKPDVAAATTPKRCASCGAEVPSGDAFCAACGTRVP